MFWAPMAGAAFPRFAVGGFDETVGHDAPPSFRLDSEGRNVAYRYRGDATATQLNCDYLVVGWIRTAQLDDGRAVLSAYHLDRDQRPITETQRFSAPVGESRDGAWQEIRVALPGGPPRARAIGLTLWIVQEDVWRPGPRPKRYIAMHNIHGRAWFDDIRIYRLPRVTLATDAPGNAFPADRPVVLNVTVSDADTRGIGVRLQVADADGRVVFGDDLTIQPGESPAPIPIRLPDIDDGLYRATLHVSAAGETLAERTLDFARVSSADPNDDDGVRALGIVLESGGRSPADTELRLLRVLRAGAVRIPVWSGRGDVPDLIDYSRETDQLLHELLRARVVVEGVFAGPPAELTRAAGAYPQSLMSVLDAEKAAWQPHLTRVVAPYASVFRSWQIGADGDSAVVGDARLPRVVQALRQEMESLTTAPQITVPGSIQWAPDGEGTGADGVCLEVDAAVLPEFIKEHLDAYRERKVPVSSAFIPLPRDGRMDRGGLLRDWFKRLVFTRHAGIETLFVSQPWNVRTAGDAVTTEPTEEFVLLHTFVELVGSADPGDRVYLAPGVTALAFDEGERSVLVMWDDHAGPDGTEYILQLGGASRQVDMWGRSTPIELTDDGRHRIRLSHSPTIVDNVERWLLALRTTMNLNPRFLAMGFERHEVEFTITNPHESAVSGELRFDPPPGWQIRPSRLSLTLAPGQTLVAPLNVSFGRDETAGPRGIDVSMKLMADRTYELTVPLEVTIGETDLDAWGLAFFVGDRLIVRHGVTNRSNETLNLRSVAIVPGRSRQYRLIDEFKAGQTITVEYHVKNGESLRGRSIRLNLREIKGPRLHNLDVPVE